MTLFDKDTGAIINSRDDLDVSADFSAGTVTRELEPDDIAIQNTDLPEETHVALFECVTAGPKRENTSSSSWWPTS